MKAKFTSQLFILLVLTAGNLLGGTSGKIAGKVFDASTKQPLVGVNVLISGTTMGAATDINGNYAILNVRPGIYSLVFSMVGYQKAEVQNVEVNIDLTTTVNNELNEAAIQGQAVVVTAERRPLVQKDMTSSLSTVTANQIQALPVDNFQQVLRLDAGIVMSGGQITIRGGRPGEVAYWVDGVSATDVYNNSMALSVENSSIQELQVVSGTFNAEYGQAMSGIVNIVTKDGGENYSGQAKIYGGNYLSNDGRFSYYKNLVTAQNPVVNQNGVNSTEVLSGDRIHPLEQVHPIYNGKFTLSGPVPLSGEHLTFFTNERYYNNPGYFYGVNWYLPDGVAGDSSVVPMNPYSNFSTQGKLTLKMGSTAKASYEIFYNKWNRDRTYYPFSSNDFPYGFSSHNYLYDPYGLPKSFGHAYTHIFELSHDVSASTYYELHVSRYYSTMSQYVFENPTQSVKYLVSVTADSTKSPPIAAESFDANTSAGQSHLKDLIQRGASYTYVPDPNGPDGYIQPNTDGSYNAPASYSFMNQGMDPTHTDRSTAYWDAKLDLTSQLTESQQLKIGVEAKLHELTMDRYQVIPATDSTGTVISPFVPAVPDPSSIYRSMYDRKPREFSAYAQDKMEFDKIIVNIGLRYDYFDAEASVPTDPTDPDIYSPFKPEHTYKGWIPMPSDYQGGLSQWIDENVASGNFTEYTPDERRAFMLKKVAPKMALSPRLGIAFPITDRGVIHFSYGHFFQIPEFQYLYSNPDFKISSGTSTNAALFGNPDLKPQRTAMYELGLQQQLSEDVGIDLTMFYRDVRDWVGTSDAPISTAQVGVTYAMFVNKDYENVRGVTLKFDKQFSNNFSFRVDYTFQIAEGTYSNPTDAYNAMLNNQAPVLALLPMNWDQRHTLNAELVYSKNDWTVSMIGTYWSGQPYTPSFPSAEATGASAVTGLTTNSAYKPDQKDIDLTISKRIRLGQFMYLELFINVYNLLDQADAVAVYSDTGSPDYTTNPMRLSQNIVQFK